MTFDIAIEIVIGMLKFYFDVFYKNMHLHKSLVGLDSIFRDKT